MPNESRRVDLYCKTKDFFNQEDFANKLNVALSTINRWELDKVRPNEKAMKAIKEFCDKNGIDYGPIESEWLYGSRK